MDPYCVYDGKHSKYLIHNMFYTRPHRQFSFAAYYREQDRSLESIRSIDSVYNSQLHPKMEASEIRILVQCIYVLLSGGHIRDFQSERSHVHPKTSRPIVRHKYRFPFLTRQSLRVRGESHQRGKNIILY